MADVAHGFCVTNNMEALVSQKNKRSDVELAEGSPTRILVLVYMLVTIPAKLH
jgi:hypothetical protein